MKPRLRELTEERERRRQAAAKPPSFDASNLSAGELANVLEGLTPDGYDAQGRKVSFVETGQPLKRRGISSGPTRRISDSGGGFFSISGRRS